MIINRKRLIAAHLEQELGKDKEHPESSRTLISQLCTKGYVHVNVHVWFLVSVSRSSRPAWSPDASFPDPDVCAVPRWSCFHGNMVPLAAEHEARGRVAKRVVLGTFSQLR